MVKGSTLRLDAAAETSDHARALQLLAAPIWLLLLIQSGCCCLPLGLPLLQLDARGLLLLAGGGGELERGPAESDAARQVRAAGVGVEVAGTGARRRGMCRRP